MEKAALLPKELQKEYIFGNFTPEMELQETTLAKVRLHWGIFIPVWLYFILIVILPFVPFLITYAIDLNSNRPVGHFHLNLMWIIETSLFVGMSVQGSRAWYAYSKCEITLTNWRLMFRTGFLWRLAGELPLKNIESICLVQSWLGRLCDYGRVKVTTIGGTRFPLTFIASPEIFHTTLQKAILNAKAAVGRIPEPPVPVTLSQRDDSRYMPTG